MSTAKYTHTNLVADCLTWLALKRLFCWENNTGALKVADRYIKFGQVGSSDILGVLPDGLILCIECKVPPDKQSKNQEVFERKIKQNHGVYVLIEAINTEAAWNALERLVGAYL